ncbi:IS1182 family transposase [Clostridioides difficile]|nr:IS1182 family transposase [Clostridioides difficile]NJK16276.1 IS1182 family transposase [Clostridioides difficile]
MLKQNTIQTDYTTYGDNYQFKLPLNIDYMIPKDDSVRLLSQIIEEMNLEKLYKTYSRVRVNKVTPRQLLKIIIYANMNCIYSSREIEKACKRDINFMYLLGGASPPDHSTIARFRSIHFSPISKTLIAQFTNFLGDSKEISMDTLFIDGTKIESSANRYTFVWKKAINKNIAKMMSNISDFILKCETDFGIKVIYKDKIKIYHLKKLLKKLKKISKELNITFVHGKGKKKSMVQKSIEQLNNYIDRLKKYTKDLHIMGERNSYSKTDNDATFMRMKEDHMKNGQLKPAYNIQFGVDSEYIVWVSSGHQPTDTTTLIPFLKSIEDYAKFKYPKIVADSGYESEENYTFLECNNQLSFIKPANYEISKTRKYKNNIGHIDNMDYDEKNDYYICKNNKKLLANKIINRKSKTGYKSEITCYTCEECHDCQYKSSCIKRSNSKISLENRTKNLQVSKLFHEKRKENLNRIMSPEGCELRVNRSIQAEGAFAQVKQNMKFRRFLSRGKENVLSECIIVAIAHNISRLHNKIVKNKCGIYLHTLKKAF